MPLFRIPCWPSCLHKSANVEPRLLVASFVLPGHGIRHPDCHHQIRRLLVGLRLRTSNFMPVDLEVSVR